MASDLPRRTSTLEASSTPAGVQAFGTACPGSQRGPALANGLPLLGNASFAVDLGSARATAASLVLLAPDTQSLSLGGGCTLYLKGTLVPFTAVTSAAGFASLGLPLPFDRGLRALALFAQAAVVDPQGPVAGLASSAALRLRIGD